LARRLPSWRELQGLRPAVADRSRLLLALTPRAYDQCGRQIRRVFPVPDEHRGEFGRRCGRGSPGGRSSGHWQLRCGRESASMGNSATLIFQSKSAQKARRSYEKRHSTRIAIARLARLGDACLRAVAPFPASEPAAVCSCAPHALVAMMGFMFVQRPTKRRSGFATSWVNLLDASYARQDRL
jgi:hypothetical protein